jgi:hypothetical protein
MIGREAEDCLIAREGHEKRPSGAQAHVNFAEVLYGLKPVPFTRTRLLAARVALAYQSRLTVRLSNIAACAVLLAALMGISGCRSQHVEITVENRTGAAIQLLEVDYPSASFGADSLAADAFFHYRLQIRGEGPVKVQYTGAGGRQEKLDGPTLYERQKGSLEIVLLPGGKAEFHSQLTPGR